MTEQAAEEVKKEIDLSQYVLKSEVEGLKANHDRLLAEKKAAQSKANEAAEEAKRIQDEAARKNGDTESLLKSWSEKENKYKEQLNEFTTKESNRIKGDVARELSAKLADGANAKLLERFISDRLKYENGGVRVLDQTGQPTVSSLDDLQKEFEANTDFESLLRGSKATGSGASKSKNGGAGIKTVTRSEFDLMDHGERTTYFKNGGGTPTE